MKRSLLNVVVCLAIAGAGVLCTAGAVLARRTSDDTEDATSRVVRVTVTSLAETMIEDSLTLTGDLIPWDEVLLSAETSGNIEWLGVDDGDSVREGDELLRINRDATEIRLNRALARYALAVQELARIQELRDRGISSPQDLDRARLDHDVVLADLRSEEEIHDSSILRAPFSGLVDRVLLEKDEFVSTGTPLVSLIQVHKLRMIVGIADQDIPWFSPGDEVTVRVNAYRDQTFTGTIRLIAARAERATHTFRTEIELDNPRGELKPGMIASARLVRQRHPNSIVVPVFSIMSRRDSQYVFVERDGIACLQPVTVAFYRGRLATIGEGLSAGDRLIIEGHRNLADGVQVDARETVQ